MLVTGAAGFVGAAVLKALRERGTEVFGLDLRTEDAPAVAACDLRDEAQIESAIGGRRLSAIVHCGAISGPALLRDDPAQVARSNVGSTLNLLEIARRRSVHRFVYASSGSVYGPTPQDSALAENRAPHPSSVYAASKIAGEALVEAYSRQFRLSGVSLRIAAVYGPGRTTPCLIREMILAGLRNEPLTVPFGGAQRYHYVYVDDVASAMVAAVAARSFGLPHYSVAADRGLTLASLAAIVRKIVPGPPIEVQSSLDPLSDPQGPYSIAAAIHDLRWRPAVDLESGIRRYAAALAIPQEK